MNNRKCERCLEFLPLVATVKAETYTIRVCRECAKDAEELAGSVPGPVYVEWDKKEKKNAH